MFHLPIYAPTKGLAPYLLSLKDLLSGAEKPSLDARLHVAQSLAESILQLHTCGWLYKSIRSENVLFIQGTGSAADVGDLNEPYLGGYEYARQEGGGEVTEEIDTTPEIDLYRYPQARAPVRAKFCKAFDVYSLGCVLLELALWTPLSSLAGKSNLEADNATYSNNMPINDIPLLPGSTFGEAAGSSVHFYHEFVKREIAFKAGRTFQEVIDVCLRREPASQFDQDDFSLALQKALVEKLSTCRY